MKHGVLRRLSMRLEAPMGRALIWSVVVIAFVFLYAPMIVVAGASFSGGAHGAIEFPPTDLTLMRYRTIPVSQYRAIWFSLELATVSAVLSVAIGVPAALGLVRGNLPGKAVIAAIFRAPIQIPAVVLGITLLQLSYTASDALNLDLAGSFTALVVAHTFIGTPYVIGTVTAILQRFDRRLEEAALSLGASPWRGFRRVTMPVIMPGLYAGALYAFMVSFSDVPIAIFLAAPDSATYPVEIFQGLEQNFDPSILASATLVIVFCFALMLVVQRLIGLETLLRTGGTGRR
jgi:putative spermidine/putrescine transport system permease protein